MKLAIKSKLLGLLTAAFAVTAIALIQDPINATAKGGSGGGGGGGGTKVKESRVTGYVTDIDYVGSYIQIGASYYGSGTLTADENTDISLDNQSCTLADLKLGDWVEARYLFVLDAATGTYIRLATKLSAGTSTSL
ncbi:MAG: hypothetical protein KDL87_11245 [Verrucomicrobiae bacterium]|nr:hypothetical protein [Verrucomicrobiae bacterium]